MTKIKTENALKILVIEDDSDYRRGLLRLLKSAGYEVVDGVDGDDCLRLYDQERPDLVLMDVCLPGRNGIEVGGILKKRQGSTAPFIVLISASHQSSGTLVKGLEAGADDYIVRPVSNGVLLARIQACSRIIRAEKKLRESEERFRELAENIPEVFWITSGDASEVIYVSPAYEKIWGRTCESLYQNPNDWIDAIIETDRERVTRSYYDNVATGGFDIEYRILRPDGTTRWIRDRGFPVRSDDGLVSRIVGIAQDVSVSKHLEESLLVRNQAFVSIGQGFIITDPAQEDNPIIYCNPAFERITGYSQGEVLGRNCRFLQNDDRQQPGAVKKIRNALANARECRVNIRNYRKDGTLFWNDLVISPVKDDHDELRFFVGVQNDVTDYRLAQEALQQSHDHLEERVRERTRELENANAKLKREIEEHEHTGQALQQFRNLIDQSNDIIFIVDPQDGGIVDFNQRAIDQLGYSTIELRKMTVLDLRVDLPSEFSWEEFREQVQKKGSMFFETRHCARDGVVYPVEVSICYVRRPAGDYLVEIVRDTTELQELRERKLRTERLATLGEFSASVAHELRNPLAAIELRLENLAAQQGISAADNNHYAQILTAMGTMTRILNDILSFAKPDTPEFRKVSIHKIIDNALGLVVSKLDDSDWTTVVEYANNDIQVFVDHSQFLQIFANLFCNALEAMPDGGILTIRTREEDQFAYIDVEDTGSGIPNENIERIFDPFFTTKRAGTGLGMAIVARLIDANRSELSVESNPGKGTKFTIAIPLA